MPENVAVTDHGLLVTGDDIGRREVIKQCLLGKGVRGLHERNLEADAGGGYHMIDSSEFTDQGVFILVGDHKAGKTCDDSNEQDDRNECISDCFHSLASLLRVTDRGSAAGDIAEGL